MMLTEKNYFIQFREQEFIEIEVWLLLTYFVCLDSHLSSIHSILTCDSSNRQKMNHRGYSFQQVLRDNLSWFLSQNSNTGKRFFLEVSF